MKGLLIFVYLYFCIAISNGNPVSTLIKAQSPNEMSRPFLTTHQNNVLLILNPHNTIQIDDHQVSHHGKFIAIVPYSPASKTFEGVLTLTGETVIFGGAVKVGEDEVLIFGSSTQPIKFNTEPLLKAEAGLFLLTLNLKGRTAIPVFITDINEPSALHFISEKNDNYLFVSRDENQKMSLIVTDGNLQKVVDLFETTPEAASSMSIIEATLEDSRLIIYGQVNFHNNSNTYTIAKKSAAMEGYVLSFRIETTKDKIQDESSWKVNVYTDKIFKTNSNQMVVVEDKAYFVRQESIVNFGLENHYLFLEMLPLKTFLTESGVEDKKKENYEEEVIHEEDTTGEDYPHENKEDKKDQETGKGGETTGKQDETTGKKDETTGEEGKKEETGGEDGKKEETGEEGKKDETEEGKKEETGEDDKKEETGEEGKKDETEEEQVDVSDVNATADKTETKSSRRKPETSSVNGWAVTFLCFLILGGIGYMLWRNSKSSPDGILGVFKNLGSQGKEWIQRKFNSDKSPQSSEEFASMKQKEFYA